MRMFIGAAVIRRCRFEPTDARAMGQGFSAVPRCGCVRLVNVIESQ